MFGLLSIGEVADRSLYPCVLQVAIDNQRHTVFALIFTVAAFVILHQFRQSRATHPCMSSIVHLLSHVGEGGIFSPQMRVNRFVFLNLPIVSLEVRLDVMASSHTPLFTGYITLLVHNKSLPCRLMPQYSLRRVI